MLYLFKDGSGYQTFPEPGPDSKPYLTLDGVAEQRILAGDPYRLIDDGHAVEFLTPQEIEAGRLADAKAAKRLEIDKWRRATENQGFTHLFPDLTEGTVQTRERDLANITGLVLAAQTDLQGTFYFRDEANATHYLIGSDVVALGSAVQAFISGNYARAWSLKDAVDAATTVADVEAITWESQP